MTKPWIMDARARRSKVYQETHAQLVREVLAMRSATAEKDEYFPQRKWWTYDSEPAQGISA